MRNRHLIALVLLPILGYMCLAPEPAWAWTTESRIAMADHALRVAPPHLVGQIERHRKEYHAGIKAAAKNDPTARSSKPSVAPGTIIETEMDRAVQSIVDHKPFSEIVFRLGVVAYWVASANDPLTSTSDAGTRPPYWQDYGRYLEDASQRFAVLYYPHDRQIESPEQLDTLLQTAKVRGQKMAPQVADEYRRIGSINGSKLFDDRSTAFGIGSLAFSHGVSDIAGVLRYIWLAAGGADTRHLPPLDEDHLILVGHGAGND